MRDLTSHLYNLLLLHVVKDNEDMENIRSGGIVKKSKMVDATFEQKLKEAQQRGINRVSLEEISTKVAETQQQIKARLEKNRKQK